MVLSLTLARKTLSGNTLRWAILTALYPLFVVSCARFAPENQILSESNAPDAFTLYEETAPVPDRWWELFESEELDRLVDQALEDNLSLQQIYARMTQAEMLARQAGALRWPTLDTTSTISSTVRHLDTGEAPLSDLELLNRNLTAVNTLIGGAPAAGADAATVLRSVQSRLRAADTLMTSPPSSSTTTTTHSYRFGLASGFEVDLWGRLHAAHEAARLEYAATQEDAYAAMLSLSGSVVRQWLAVAAQRQELELIREQRVLNKTTLELMELRYRNGLATALDVFQQRQIVAQTESLIPPLESSIQVNLHELAVLLGKAPREELDLGANALPGLGPLPAPGLPADLLAYRPDVQAAGLQLQTAQWRIAAARANRLPALRLTGSASYGAEEWSLVFDNWMASLAGSLTGPIFDAGQRKAEVERTRAVAEERLARYRERVLQSVKEVENGLLRESKQAEYIEALRRELEVARTSHQQAEERYRKGLNDYLPVLSALTQIQVLERRLVQAEYARHEQRVVLCVALGGTWMKGDLDHRRQQAPAAPAGSRLDRDQE
jgi:outer membrane protein, multidrug efflux system